MTRILLSVLAALVVASQAQAEDMPAPPVDVPTTPPPVVAIPDPPRKFVPLIIERSKRPAEEPFYVDGWVFLDFIDPRDDC